MIVQSPITRCDQVSKANRNLHALYWMVLFPVTLSDPDYRKPPNVQFSTFCIAFHNLICSECRYRLQIWYVG